MKTSSRLHRRIAATLLTVLLLSTSTSCGNMDGIMDEAKDVIDAAGDVVKEVGEAIKDDEDPAQAASSGGQTAPRPPRPTGSVSTGDETPLTSGTVGPSGGTVTVQKPGDPLDGLEIQVPPGSYPDSRQFDVSSAPINGHSFGEHFTPATPLISIENGGDYSEEFMTVTIPVEVPPDHFAMAFYYDDGNGTLEGIPFNAMDEHSVTIVTRHFCDIIISIIKNTALEDLISGDIDSHFRPGAHDWQFTNYGSYIAKGGHCAGQCLTALWYFCEQPDGTDPFLWGLYDNNGNHPATPDLWQDDSHGYRLASTVQKDINWSSFENKLMENLAGQDDELAYKAFAYSLKLTGEPQEVGIFSSAGGGHDMICYRVHNNNLYIADPNYPGNSERRIEFVNGAFKPYESGANAAEIAAGNSKTYETIQFCAKTATIDWNIIGARWNEFKAGTVGNDKFPPYEIVVVDDEGKEEPLVDGYESEHRKISIVVKANPTIGTKVYRNGTRLAQDATGKYELDDGNNLIGIEIWGDVNNDPQDRAYRYIDFQYFNVQYGEKECEGWLLDSIEEREYVTLAGTDPTRQGFSFEASSDGWFSGSGRHMTGVAYDTVLADFVQSGSWTPLPDCIGPEETVRIELNCSASVTPGEAGKWGIMSTYLILSNSSYTDDYGRINHELWTTDPPAESTTTAEFQLHEGFDGIGPRTVLIRCGTDAGWAEYAYTYVWQG